MSLQAKEGLPRGNQAVGWIVLVIPLLMPFVHRLAPNKHYLHRLMLIFLTFSPVFVILTISYEGLFYLGFCATLITWVRLEHNIYAFSKSKTATTQANGKAILPASLASSPFRSLTLSDARVSLFFLTLLQSAFFSTGNVASVSSFSLESVQRIVPVFDPFSQGALLIIKLMVPFALISANLGILNKRLGVAPSALFMVVMAISDFLTLHFFWVVKDEGSWLEIGSTISHFVIASLLCVFVASLEGVSEMFIAGVEVEDYSSQMVKEKELGGVVSSEKKGVNGVIPRKPVANGSSKST
jgi:phosphatidylinositol glycan class N